MQAIILAAGLAKRLRPLTDTTPKCLLDVCGKNLLHRTMENVIKNGINDFIFVTGYRENMIKDYLNKNFMDVNMKFLTNTDYSNNNNSYSLWMTKDFVKDGFILLDSDIVFDSRIIKKLLADPNENAAAVNTAVKLDDEQIKVTVDSNNRILRMAKDVPIHEAIGESIGIEKFSKSLGNEIFKILDRKVLKDNNVNEFYEKTFEDIIERNDPRNSIYSVDVSEYESVEIDTVDDYKKAQNELKHKHIE
ncbi:MAG: phosphocholine cytidylyltransferase family protein [Candidatus Kapaibacterium sp.]